MPGGSLRERLEREGTLSVHDTLRIAEEVSTALDFAHRAGFVHRDVKPENILFADGHALLADFGVARVAFGQGAEDEVTAAGLAIGTPEYMRRMCTVDRVPRTGVATAPSRTRRAAVFHYRGGHGRDGGPEQTGHRRERIDVPTRQMVPRPGHEPR